MKTLSFIRQNPTRHWVGNGFPVRNVFSYRDVAVELDPFLLLDYAGPYEFPPTDERLGVGEHPHRGFETVTIVYSGEVEHRDSSGGGGKIGPGEVQWMTAASGVVHEEFHGRHYAKTGGLFEVVQLWVNLPKKNKLSEPGYQSITADRIPEIALPENAGLVRVIAGNYQSHQGPAKTFTPMKVFDVRLKAGTVLKLEAAPGDTASVFLLQGQLKLGSGERVTEASLVNFSRSGEGIEVTAEKESKLLFLSGTPIQEPIVGYGPFVMNTKSEIEKAFLDYSEGKMGHLK